MSERGFVFPLAVQLLLPEDFREQPQTRRRFALLAELGLSGVELNFFRFDRVDPAELADFLDDFGLRCTMFATGYTARNEGLSLSSGDEKIRLRSVERSLAFIDFAARLKAGLIVGFLKGGPDPDREEARRRFADSLARLAPRAEAAGVPLLIEATNRYESAVANSLAEAAELVRPYAAGGMRLLPDTFHMNIEEADPIAALKDCAQLFDSIHLSDNNRCFPGLGAIDFSRYLEFLERSGWRGWLAIEGNLRRDLESDLRASLARLTVSPGGVRPRRARPGGSAGS
jgi:D-psicose/D-tagatose/L-ribulose 3-epimerase